jgi:hypothetical protein
MDYVTRQFINLTKKFRKELSKALQQETDAIRDATKAARESKHDPIPIPLPVIAELQLPKAKETERTKRENRAQGVQIWLAAVTTLTFLAAAIYAGIAARQLHQMRKATKATEDAAGAAVQSAKDADTSLIKSDQFFKRDQRAYLYVRLLIEKNNGFSEPQISVTNHIGVNFQVLNSGKTPANSMRQFGLVSFQESNKIEGENRAFDKAMRDTQILREGREGIRGGTPVLPAVATPSTFFTISSEALGPPPLWTSAEIADISARKRFIYATGTIEYRDLFNDLHTTEFCTRWSTVNIGWEFCRTHNKIE